MTWSCELSLPERDPLLLGEIAEAEVLLEPAVPFWTEQFGDGDSCLISSLQDVLDCGVPVATHCTVVVPGAGCSAGRAVGWVSCLKSACTEELLVLFLLLKCCE